MAGSTSGEKQVESRSKPTDETDPYRLEDLRYIGPATENVLRAAGVTPTDILEKSISYELLIALGVNPGVAGKIRREHSLPWSFERTAGATLRRRATHIRGLGSAERVWIFDSTVPDEE